MDKLNLTNLHPNLIMGMSEFEISDFIAKLLQSLRDLEEQQEVEGSYKQLKTEQKKLKKEQEQLKLDQDLLKLGQEQLKTNQEQLMKYQAFILKLSRQNEEIKANIQKLQDPKLKRRSGSNHS